MNSVLLSIAVAIVLALCGALVAPFFIDWNAYRDVVEARLSKAFGYEVVINGQLNARILPYPVLDIQELEIRGQGLKFPLVIIPQLHADLALAPILRGYIEVTDIELDQPIVTLPMGAGGVPTVPAGQNVGVSQDSVEISDLNVANGTLVVVDGEDMPLKTISGISFNGHAVSLAGPFKIEGVASTDTETYSYKISTGRRSDSGAIRAKIDIDPSSVPRHFSLDALFSLENNIPVLDGTFKIAQSLRQSSSEPQSVPLSDIPWQVAGSITGAVDNLVFQDLKLSAGPEALNIALEGVARLQFGTAPKLEALLTSRQIDFDRAMGRREGTQAATSITAMAEMLGEAAALVGQVTFPVSLAMTADVAIVGGDLVEQVTLDIVSDRGVIRIERAEARLPGSSLLGFVGQIEPANSSVTGEIRLESGHTATLAQWLGLDPKDFGPLFAPGERVKLALLTSLQVDPLILEFKKFNALLNDTEVSGSLVLPISDVNNEAPRKLAIDLSFNELDLDRYVSSEGIGGGAADISQMLANTLRGREVSVKLKSGKITVFGITAEGLRIDASMTDSGLLIRQLELENLAGTSVNIVGQLANFPVAPNGNIRADIKSSDLRGVASLLAKLGLNNDLNQPLFDAEQAVALSPANIQLMMEAAPGDEGIDAKVNMTGELAGSNVSAEVNYRGQLEAFLDGYLSGDMSVESPDSMTFLRQTGVKTSNAELVRLTRDVLFETKVYAAFEGILSEPLSANAELQLFDSKITFNGGIWPGTEAVATEWSI